MTRRDSSVLVALSVASLLFAASPAVAGGPTCKATFAQRAAGTFLLDTDFVGISLRSLTTLSSEGIISSEDTSDYGALGPDFPRFQSDQRGSWKRTGRREAEFLTIGFDFDPEGQPIGILRLRGRMQFDRGFDGYRVADGLVEVFFDTTVDPLDPTLTPDITLPWTGAARRIPSTLD